MLIFSVQIAEIPKNIQQNRLTLDHNYKNNLINTNNILRIKLQKCENDLRILFGRLKKNEEENLFTSEKQKMKMEKENKYDTTRTL